MFKTSKAIRAGIFVSGALVLAATTACTAQQTSAPQPGSPGSESGAVTAGSAGSSAGAAAGNGTPTPRSEGGFHDCGVNELKLTMGESNGGMGHIYAPIQFTNTGPITCKLSSAPGVSYVGGDDGHQIGEPAKRTIKDRPEIVIEPGQTASAPFLFSPTAHMNPQDCAAQPARGLRVYPPNSTESMFLPLPDTMSCTTYTQDSDFAEVGVVQAGPDNTVIS